MYSDMSAAVSQIYERPKQILIKAEEESGSNEQTGSFPIAPYNPSNRNNPKRTNCRTCTNCLR